MANRTAGTATPATIAGTTPAKGVPNHRPTPPRRLAAPAEPTPFTPFDFLERLGDLGKRFWGILELLQEEHRVHSHQGEPLPEWALNLIKAGGPHRENYNEFCVQEKCLREALRLAEGEAATFVYEVWADNLTRLSLRHASVADALPDLERFKTSGPWANAKIVQVYRRRIGRGAHDPHLLDSFIGDVAFLGISLGEANGDEQQFQLEDETGRTVTLTARQLRGHPIIDRIGSRHNKASLVACLQREDLPQAAGDQP